MNEVVTNSILMDGHREPSQSEVKSPGIIRRLVGSLAFKVGAAIVITEILVLTGIGIPLIASHNEDVDRSAADRILIPGTLLQARSYSNTSGRICGKSNTSRIDGESVNSITRRSMPIPMPAVGGMPYSSARM